MPSTDLHLVPSLRTSTATPLLALYAFMTRTATALFYFNFLMFEILICSFLSQISENFQILKGFHIYYYFVILELYGRNGIYIKVNVVFPII